MSDPISGRGDGGIECVTSFQLRLMCLCTFAASALFSIFLFALGQQPDTSRVENVQTVNVVGNDKSALVENSHGKGWNSMACEALYDQMILAQAQAAVDEAAAAVELAEAEIAQATATASAEAAWDAEVEWIYCMGGGGSSSRVTTQNDMPLRNLRNRLMAVRERFLGDLRQHLAHCQEQLRLAYGNVQKQ